MQNAVVLEDEQPTILVMGEMLLNEVVDYLYFVTQQMLDIPFLEELPMSVTDTVYIALHLVEL